MLTVEELCRQLSYGRFSNLAIGNEGVGTVRESDLNKVISGLNSALTRIYSRFALSEKQVMIVQQAHITNYHLDKRFALCNPERLPEHVPYILDLPNEPFINDAIKIIAVFDSLGSVIAINDETHPFSLFTPSPTTLQIPLPKHDEPMSVQYQAAHPRLEYGVKQTEVIVPLVLEEALLSYTAYSIYSNMNTQESTVKAAEHLQMYEVVCTEVESQGYASIASQGSNKFTTRGFV